MRRPTDDPLPPPTKTPEPVKGQGILFTPTARTAAIKKWQYNNPKKDKPTKGKGKRA